MYQVITWDPATTARPVVARTAPMGEMCRLLYAAGRAHHDVMVDEYTYDEEGGVGFVPVFDSTVGTKGGTP